MDRILCADCWFSCVVSLSVSLSKKSRVRSVWALLHRAVFPIDFRVTPGANAGAIINCDGSHTVTMAYPKPPENDLQLKGVPLYHTTQCEFPLSSPSFQQALRIESANLNLVLLISLYQWPSNLGRISAQVSLESSWHKSSNFSSLLYPSKRSLERMGV